MAVGDITVDKDFEVKDGGDSLWREINATIINAGNHHGLICQLSLQVENLQGEDKSDFLDVTEPVIQQLQVTQYTEI